MSPDTQGLIRGNTPSAASSYCRTEHFTTDVRREPLSPLISSPCVREEFTYFCPAVSGRSDGDALRDYDS